MHSIDCRFGQHDLGRRGMALFFLSFPHDTIMSNDYYMKDELNFSKDVLEIINYPAFALSMRQKERIQRKMLSENKKKNKKEKKNLISKTEGEMRSTHDFNGVGEYIGLHIYE